MNEAERVDEHTDAAAQVLDNHSHVGEASSVQFTRWTKYGRDRLYVRNADGIQVGWIDLRAGQTHVADGAVWPASADEMVAHWCAEHGVTPPAPHVDPVQDTPEPTMPAPPPPSPGVAAAPEPTTVTSTNTEAPANVPGDSDTPAPGRVKRPWTDLAKNRAGASVKAAAKERRTWWTRLQGLFGVRTETTSWDAGYKGERKAARTFLLMRPFGWRVLHSVPVGDRGADIDHVLIGPGGVVTVNAKHHRRAKVTAGHTKVLVNGYATNYAQKSTFEADRAARLLSAAAGYPVDVQAIIAIIGARSVRNGHTAGIDVLTRIELPIWGLSHRGRLDRQQRRELFEIARKSTTWQGL